MGLNLCAITLVKERIHEICFVFEKQREVYPLRYSVYHFQRDDNKVVNQVHRT